MIKERKRRRPIQGICTPVGFGLYSVMLYLHRRTGCAESLQLLINLGTWATFVSMCTCIILVGVSLLYSVHLPPAVIIPCSSTEEL